MLIDVILVLQKDISEQIADGIEIESKFSKYLDDKDSVDNIDIS